MISFIVPAYNEAQCLVETLDSLHQTGQDADTVVNVDVVRSAVRSMRDGMVGGGAGLCFDEPVPVYARLLLRVIVRIFTRQVFPLSRGDHQKNGTNGAARYASLKAAPGH